MRRAAVGAGAAPETGELPIERFIDLVRFGEGIPVDGGRRMLVAVDIGAGSAAVGQAPAEALAAVEGARPVALLGARELCGGARQAALAVGDRLVLIATPEAFNRVAALASGPPRAGTGG